MAGQFKTNMFAAFLICLSAGSLSHALPNALPEAFLDAVPAEIGLFSRAALTPAANSTLPGNWSYLGCFNDGNPRTLPSSTYADTKAMDGSSCVAYCAKKNYAYAGTEYAQECYCGNTIGVPAYLNGDGNCSMACTGNSGEACGAGGFLSVYYANKAAPKGPSVNPGPPGWTSYGCWTDGNPRTLANGVNIAAGSQNMTVALCTSACGSAGYTIAGTEYAGECYCDNNVAAGATNATLSDCNMPCNGNATEFCGAGGRLNLYASGTTVPTAKPVVTPTAAPAPPTSWNSLGCYSDNTNGNRGLANGVNVQGGGANMTVENCISACSAAGYNIAGLEYSGECYCDNSFTNGMAPVTDGRCSMKCNGNSAEICGGANGLSVYQFNGWYPLGCLADNVGGNGRALTVGTNVLGGGANMTNSNCQTACAAGGYSLAGTEYSGECFCDNKIMNGGTPATDGRCSMTCNGNKAEICGGANGLTLYQFNSSSLPVAPGATTTTTAAGTTPTQPTTSSVNATAILPYKYSACWTDNMPAGRMLNYLAFDSNTNTVESCIAACSAKGYAIAGMEYSSQCFCDSYARNNATMVADTDCSMTCGGNTGEKCGAGGRLSVYVNGTISAYTAPSAQTTGLPAGWSYQGCLSDGGNMRTLPYLTEFANNSNSQCISLCQKFGYDAAGTEYGTQCFCGSRADVVNAAAKPLADSTCNIKCANDSSGTTGGSWCGGLSALSYYTFNNAAALYNFTYATGNDAGAYQFLIGGVVVPLVTAPARNGKITFLEKSGTGAPNTTGAYELDLAQLGNFSAAWRPMHVKTDIFCSASLTLPDKAGRQINVGGWSGDSTYGVRLYLPDGSPGVAGMNDWQENYQKVKLGAGRWYPSAMTLSNGSILVMGGEQGSNGAPVPSLEVLPSPSGEVKFCDYLNRTDPFNLYPFLIVLPSGGIFVGYYNEARILDPVSLTTTSVLPIIPGAVNRPDAGRTYPLEGAAVILPLSAPYSDPATILVCGGSTSGAATPLDNCVSISPDAPNATWTLERMPSKRVMPNLCALPDGTYLIANGAMAGVAGFGLANNPNFNAVLYDPRKPINSRMTIMANTTVARLYHSEAVLMDDARVLISGSDPQDGVNPEEYRVEVFVPPYLLNGAPRPAFTISNIDFAYGQSLPFNITQPGSGGTFKVSFMGAVASTHGNSMGQRTIFPAVSCTGTTCSVTAPPNANICPPGWFQMFVLDQNNIPSNATWVRIGGDPGSIGNWPNFPDFTLPGLGAATKLY